MASETVYIFIGIIAVVLVIILVLSFRGKGQPIKCPECGFKFKRPLAEKSIGAGFAPRGLGSYTCPNCKYRGRTSKFERAPDLDNSENQPHK